MQVLARRDRVADPAAWVWRAAFRIAAGELARRTSGAAPLDHPFTEAGYERIEEADALRLTDSSLAWGLGHPPTPPLRPRASVASFRPPPGNFLGCSTAGGTSVTNTATVSSGTTDPTTANNSPQATTEVGSLPADLSVHKSASPHPVKAGKKLTYTIAIRDHGPDGAQDVVLVDHLPKRTKFLSISGPPAWTCTTPPEGDRGTVRCTRDLLAAGATSRIVLVVRVGSCAPAGALIIQHGHGAIPDQ